MQCIVCKVGLTRPGKTTVTFDRGNTTLVFKGVPAEVCENCDEAYVNSELSKQLLATAEQASTVGVRVDVREFVVSQS